MVALHEDSGTGNLECDNCESGDPPVNRCTTCSHFLCEFCTQGHRRGRSTSSHSLMSLEQAKKLGSVAITRPSLCKEHEGEVMKLFCDTCEEAICRDCTIVKHRDHKYTFVKDAFSKGKESLLKILSETKTKVSVLEQAVDGVLKMKSNVHSRAEETVQEVINCFKELTACLDARQRQLIHNIEELKKAKLKSLEIQQEELQTALGSVRSSVEFTEKAFENGSEVEILNMRKQISSRLRDLNSAKWKLKPCVNEELNCKGDSNQLKCGITTFGVVTDLVTHAAMSTVTMENGQEGVMYNTLCGQSVTFNIIAKGCNRQKQKEGGDIFEVFIKNKQQKVKDCGNGMYSFSFTPFTVGQYKLFVQMKGHHVQGSPFQWCVEKWNLVPFALDNSKGQLKLSEQNLTAQYIELPLDHEDDEEVGEWPRWSGTRSNVSHYALPSYYDQSVLQPVQASSTKKGEINGPSVLGSDVFKNGKHMWKVQIFVEPSQGFSFGIINTIRNRKSKLVRLGNKWVWSAKKKQYPPQAASPVSGSRSAAQTAIASSITNCISGDIIELYLDFEDGKLRMYNPRTQQSDIWQGVKEEVTPVFHLTTDGDRVSLKIPQKV